ncbi:CHAT domain-containing tetratricopeptide repeat protein [Micromonospora sp. 4G57]|uniref:CHAT domain-containing tetratricopeptide repeat protein n=1 Tax=Micromonospora sicca TaxID=2202420 RepID=A0ABU5JN29_9ACTN|nr:MULTISPECIES: CHAT domain-containing tetratricopeptide repeat protein [unclassified Micromonospora]MDZ5446507.1 CHAT domain-containing tetratricopeptide repeat protein [Micromonospora sp. 4G57]MDZ5494032.1 CHAT domain-containing tetratricopeptide repeat protein [Micromonospora sp. 4G53]
MDAGLRDDLVRASLVMATGDDAGQRRAALEWFTAARPALMELVKAGAPDSAELLNWMIPFLVVLRDWPALAEQSERGRRIAVLADDFLIFTQNLGIAMQHLERDAAAERLFREVVDGAERIGEEGLRARALAHLGQLRRQARVHDEAADLYHRSALAYRACGDRAGEARALGDVSQMVSAMGHHEAAIRYAEQSRELFRGAGDLEGEARAVRALAGARMVQDRVDAALELLDEGVALFDAVPSPSAAAEAAFAASDFLARRCGDLPGAIRYAELAEARLPEDPQVVAWRTRLETEADLCQLCAAPSRAAGERLVAARPLLRTELALDLALQLRRDCSARERRRLDVLVAHPDSALAARLEAQWRLLQDLSAGTELPDRLRGLLRQSLLDDGEQSGRLLESMVAAVPADRYPAVHGLLLFQRALAVEAGAEGRRREAIDLASAAADLLERAGAEELSAAALAMVGSWWRRLGGPDPRGEADEAIRALRRVLRTYRRRTHPAEWASTMLSLGNAYLEYPVDRRASALRAQDRITAALTVLTLEHDPQAHATALMDLGLAWSAEELAEIPGSLARAEENLARALPLLRDPGTVAACHTNLSLVLRAHIEGDRDANLDRALHHARAAQAYYDAEGGPADRADAANAVGTVLAMRATAEGRPAPAEAIESFRGALALVPVDRAPLTHAGIAGNLANALESWMTQDAAHLAEALRLYETAVRLFRRHGAGREESKASRNFAYALSRLPDPDHDRIVALLDRSLAGRPVAEVPGQWVESAVDLAEALTARGRASDAQLATELLERCRQLVTVGRASHQAGRVYATLGHRCGAAEDWLRAAQFFREAVAEVENSYGTVVAGSGREAELSRAAGLHQDTAYALARCGRFEEAVTVLEDGRARELGRLLDRDRSDIDRLRARASRQAEEYEAAVTLLADAERQQRILMPEDEAQRWQVRGMLADAQARLRAVLEAIRALPGFADFAKRPVDAPFRASAPEAPLCYLLTARLGSAALLVTASREIIPRFAPLTVNVLFDTLVSAEAAYDDAVLDLIGSSFLGTVGELLAEQGAPAVVLVPTGLLGALPLHAARYRRAGRTRHLIDDADVSYTPSARALLAAQDVAPSERPRLLTACPEDALPHTVQEVTAVQRLFTGPVHNLFGAEATREAVLAGVRDATHVHLACHGSYDPVQPLRSCLYLAGLDQLSALDLFDHGLLRDVQLVVASACESAVTDIARTPDEAFGLPGLLGYCGAATVVGSLWNVNDKFAALLISRFYSHYRDGDTPARALARAQRWLRDAGPTDLTKFAAETGVSSGPRLVAALPQMWAAFVVVGSSGRPVES